AAGEGGDGCVDALQVAAESAEGAAGEAAHGRPVQHVEGAQHPAAEHLAAQVQVGRRVEVGGAGQVLVHRLDAVPLRVERVAEVHQLPVEGDLAAVRLDGATKDFDQRALAGPVVADQGDDLAGVGREVRAP